MATRKDLWLLALLTCLTGPAIAQESASTSAEVGVRPAYLVDTLEDGALKDKLAAIFKTKTRADWDALLEHSDVCYAPVLTMSEAREHPHNSARQTFVEVAGTPQPAPAPRYSGTATATPSPAPMPGDDTADILAELGLSEGEIAEFRQAGAVS